MSVFIVSRDSCVILLLRMKRWFMVLILESFSEIFLFSLCLWWIQCGKWFQIIMKVWNLHQGVSSHFYLWPRRKWSNVVVEISITCLYLQLLYFYVLEIKLKWTEIVVKLLGTRGDDQVAWVNQKTLDNIYAFTNKGCMYHDFT